MKTLVVNAVAASRKFPNLPLRECVTHNIGVELIRSVQSKAPSRNKGATVTEGGNVA